MFRNIAATGMGVAMLCASSARADPRCAGPDNWPASMTFAQLKNAGVLSNDKVDFSLTSVRQIASEKIGRDLYRQVFEVAFHLKDGKLVRAIAVSDASMDECSISDVTVYRIAEGRSP